MENETKTEKSYIDTLTDEEKAEIERLERKFFGNLFYDDMVEEKEL